MAVTRYTKMAYDCADDMVFGKAKQPVSYGFGLKIGAGEVIPEVNYAPRPGTEKDADRLRKEYVDYISKDILNRAVTAGFPNVQLETEWVSQMNQAKLSAPVVEGQKAICEKYHEEYGVNCAVRHTIPDQREAEEGLRPGMGGSHAYPEKLFECAEIACENGADNLSCESVGGKEFADYAVTNGDIVAFLFGVGYLGSIDMTYIWSEFSEIAKKNKCVAGGDTNCSGANVSMFMAGGFLDNDVQKTFSAVTRCISAARTLAAWEAGAVGPDKDWWSNESVEYHPEFGGSSVQCWFGSLGYECALMNTATQLGTEKQLRDMYMYADRFRGPEAYVLAYDHAYEVGKAIAENGNDLYLRAKAAGLTGAKIILKGYESKELGLTNKQLDTLQDIIKKLEALPDDTDKFYDYCVKEFKDTVPLYNPKSYDL